MNVYLTTNVYLPTRARPPVAPRARCGCPAGLVPNRLNQSGSRLLVPVQVVDMNPVKNYTLKVEQMKVLH